MSYTIQEWEQMVKRIVISMHRENGWIVLTLETGLRVKFKEWKTEYDD